MSKLQLLGLVTLVVALGVQGLQSSPASHRFLQTHEKFVPAPPELPTAGGYAAVSTTMKCVINLTIQYAQEPNNCACTIWWGAEGGSGVCCSESAR